MLMLKNSCLWAWFLMAVCAEYVPGAPVDIPVLPQFRDVPFTLGLARMDGAENVQLLATMFKPVLEQKEEAVNVVNKVPVAVEDPVTKKQKTHYKEVRETQYRTVIVERFFPETVICEMKLDDTVAFQLDGTKADTATVRERLKEQAVVIVTSKAPMVPDQFRVLFKPGTLIIPLQGRVPPPPGPQDKFKIPAGPPPTFRVVSVNENDFFALKVPTVVDRVTTGCVTVTKQVEAEPGKIEEVHELAPVELQEQFRASHTTLVPLQFVTGKTAEGNPMLDAHIAALKQREMPAVVSRNGMPVDAGWLWIIKPKMLVLAPPASEPPQRTSAPGSTPVPVPQTDKLPRPAPALSPQES